VPGAARFINERRFHEFASNLAAEKQERLKGASRIVKGGYYAFPISYVMFSVKYRFPYLAVRWLRHRKFLRLISEATVAIASSVGAL